MPPPSAAASRFAAHWVADALAADEDLDFSAIKALVGVSPESLTGAPEAVRERVALRCLQELVAVTAEGGSAAALAPAAMLRVDFACSCEDLLLELIGKVGSSGSLENDMLPPFTQDIQNIICTNKPTLPETCFELLREVDPEITSLAPPSTVEQNGNNKHDNDQSLCNISHDHVNKEKPRFPTYGAELQQENLANLVNETDTGNLQKDPIEPTPGLHQPCTSDSRCYEHPQEDAIGAVGISATDVEGNMSVAAVPASAICNAALQGSITEPLSKEDAVDNTTMVKPQSSGGKYPNPPHYNDGERPHDHGTSNQSSKDASHEGLSVQATVAPAFDRSNDALQTNASEASLFPEFIIAEDTTMTPHPHSCETHLSSPQHDSGEKVNQDLYGGSASIQPVEKYPVHEQLTLQAASVLPSVSCNDAIQGHKSETNHPPGNTTEHTTMFEQQNGELSRQR